MTVSSRFWPEGANHHLLINTTSGDDHTQYQLRTEKDAASGYPSLDANTLVPTAELGTGVADATSYLRGDHAWITPDITDAVRTFTETTGAGTYTATVVIPAGAKVDISLLSNAVWSATVSAVLDVVDGNNIHLFNALDLKAAVPAGQMVFPDVHVGALHASRGALLYPAGTTLTMSVVTVGASGSTGVTHVYVDWSFPETAVAAVKA